MLSQATNSSVAGIGTAASAIAARQPLRYAGYTYDAHSATYYLSQRHYDPATMRFLTKDPARDDGEESAYQYCGGDPVGKVDPTGEAAIVLAGLVIPAWVVAAVVAVAVWAVIPADVKAELSRQMDSHIRNVIRNAKDKYPKDKYTWKWSTHKPHLNNATIKANLPKGGAAKKAKWLVNHHRYRYHAHVDIYRNGVKVARINI